MSVNFCSWGMIKPSDPIDGGMTLFSRFRVEEPHFETDNVVAFHSLLKGLNDVLSSFDACLFLDFRDGHRDLRRVPGARDGAAG